VGHMQKRDHMVRQKAERRKGQVRYFIATLSLEN
jgi:hypothetical protein